MAGTELGAQENNCQVKKVLTFIKGQAERLNTEANTTEWQTIFITQTEKAKLKHSQLIAEAGTCEALVVKLLLCIIDSSLNIENNVKFSLFHEYEHGPFEADAFLFLCSEKASGKGRERNQPNDKLSHTSLMKIMIYCNTR